MELIKNLEQIFRSIINDAKRQAFVRSVGGIMLLRLIGVFLTFLSSMVLARILGTQGYGLYSYIIAIVAVLAFLATLGLPQYLVREGAVHKTGTLWLRRWADKKVIIAGVLISLTMMLAGWLNSDIEQRFLFLLAGLIPTLSALSEVRRSLLQANGLVVRSQLSAMVIVPLVMLIGLALMLHVNSQVEAWEVMALTVTAAFIPYLINGLQLRCIIKNLDEIVPEKKPHVSISNAIRFMWLGALYLLLNRSDLIMLGLISSNANAGIYAVASRAADLVPILLIASNMVIAPKIAILYRDGELEKLKKMLTTTIKVVVFASLPLALLLFFGANWLLLLFYGEDYAEGALVLRLLVVAQFIVVLGGPLGTTLEMTGNEKACLIATAWVVILNIILNALLIPKFGGNGAAVASCVSLIIGRILLWKKVRQFVLLRPTARGN